MLLHILCWNKSIYLSKVVVTFILVMWSAVWPWRRRLCLTIILIVHIIVKLYFFWSSGIKDWILLTFENSVPLMRYGVGEGQWCGIFHYYWWTASIKPILFFHKQTLLLKGFPYLPQINHLVTLQIVFSLINK